jgi:hypothetical protein
MLDSQKKKLVLKIKFATHHLRELRGQIEVSVRFYLYSHFIYMAIDKELCGNLEGSLLIRMKSLNS